MSTAPSRGLSVCLRVRGCEICMPIHSPPHLAIDHAICYIVMVNCGSDTSGLANLGSWQSCDNDVSLFLLCSCELCTFCNIKLKKKALTDMQPNYGTGHPLLYDDRWMISSVFMCTFHSNKSRYLNKLCMLMQHMLWSASTKRTSNITKQSQILKESHVCAHNYKLLPEKVTLIIAKTHLVQ